ncbi:choline/ethanolamine kinase [Ectocarpus siliculosus]|uniref:ethanolamine kinase n=1 Tax=Ectocarpus siliculosus TaxID=2880 RepID=D7G1J0_ECTSI|nr:choline/ethanolamine kinase [Ectocarpus siliculosus]|eukprot:CBJ26798.1 choline/ethanolamine kinase [Ectocarpus siliculosus]
MAQGGCGETRTEGGQYCRDGSSTRQGFLKAGGLAAAGVIAAMGAVPGTIVEGRGRAVEMVEAAVGVDEPAVLLQKEVLSYVREALPGWRTLPDGDIQLKQITGGITNVIFKARNTATGEGALVRVYGKDTDLLLDRRKEAAVFSELSTLGFGPRKLGEFKGGRIEELLDARAATPEELLQTSPFDVPQAIAVQLASLHGQRVRSSAGSPDRPVMWTSIDKWLKTATRLDSTKSFPLAKKLAAEIANGVVFAHNDLLSGKRRGHTTDGAHDFTGDALIAPFTRALEWFSSTLGNVLVGPRGAKKISTLRLIDFEYSDYNPCGYDIANHFCECAGFDADFRRRYPSDKQRQAFLRAYVEAARPEALQNALSADNVISELARLVDRYTLASHLTWALWAVIQANTSEIEGFDFAGYATKRLDGYAFHKEAFYA